MTLKNHPYLYLGSVSEARRNDELEMWRDSHKQNILCKQAIEETIRKGFDGMHLDQDCARSVIEEYGFKRVNLFRKEQEQLQMFDRTHCTTMTGQELEGKVLVMSPYTLKESYWAPENQLWLASGGFGCSPTAAGRAVYATCLGDGEHARWNREDFIGILEEQHIPAWAEEKLAELRPAQQEQTAGPVMGGMTME